MNKEFIDFDGYFLSLNKLEEEIPYKKAYFVGTFNNKEELILTDKNLKWRMYLLLSYWCFKRSFLCLKYAIVGWWERI